MRPGPFCGLPDPGAVGVYARASEEPVEVAVCGPGSCSAAEDSEDDIKDRIRVGTAYGEAHRVQHDLYDLPPASPDETDDGARDHGAAC